MIRAYKFLKDDFCSGSGNEPAWEIGKKRTIRGKLAMCSKGYHSSPSWYDALNYAPGSVACIVEVSRPVQKDKDKFVSHKCKIVQAVNVEKVLRTWACDCAERALKAAKVTDERSWNAIRVARLYNEGKATKQELAAAWSAAWSAAESAADSAAWLAAESAARSAARLAEISWQKQHLDELMNPLFEERKK